MSIISHVTFLETYKQKLSISKINYNRSALRVMPFYDGRVFHLEAFCLRIAEILQDKPNPCYCLTTIQERIADFKIISYVTILTNSEQGSVNT